MKNSFLSLIVLFITASCGQAPTPHTEVVRIGFSLDSLVVERWSRDVEAFLKAAEKLKAEVVLEISGQDPVKQNEQIRNLVNRGVNVLVVVPNDWRSLRDSIAYAKEQRVPVIGYDRLLREAGADLYISFDNRKVGRLMAGALAEAVPEGDWIIVNGASNDDNSAQLAQGFSDIISPLVSTGRLRIAGEIRPKVWSSGEVIPELESLLTEHPNVTGILAGNDMFAEAVIRVLGENRMTGSVKVVGQDADLAACQRIAERTQYATIYKPVKILATLAAGYAVALARKEPIEVENIIFDGRLEIPYVGLQPRLVTLELLDETVISDGYHKAQDVYRYIR